MENDKNLDFNEKESEYSADSASRARNRTVMLTPEVTGEVRARLAKDMSQHRGVDPATAGSMGAGASSTYSPAGDTAARGHREAISSRPIPESGTSRASFGQGAPQSGGGGGFVAPIPSVQKGDRVVWGKESLLIGFLVSYDADPNGKVFELRVGRLIVTSEGAATGNFLILDHETVSPMHAIVRVSADGEIQVLDQLSEYGTKIRRFGSDDEKELSGEKGTLEHGDVITFGARKFHVCLITRSD